MKFSFLAGLALVLTLLVPGCGDSSSKPKTQSDSGSALNAPANYLGAATKAQQGAVKVVDVSAINQAIKLFNVDQGRYPTDLNELVQKKYLPQMPQAPAGSRFEYDATAGQVKVVRQ